MNALVAALCSYASSSLHGEKNGWTALAEVLAPFFVPAEEDDDLLYKNITCELFAMCCIAEMYDFDTGAARGGFSVPP